MTLSLSLGHNLRQTVKLGQSLKLTHAQKVQLQEYVLQLRLELIEALREEKYEPVGDCPHCNRKMTPGEIVRGFRADPNDYTTECTGCHKRFEPKLVCTGRYSRLELPFFCSDQTLERLRHIKPIPAAEFQKEYAAEYRAAIVHHGGLRNAYAKIGVQYAFEEIHQWQKKVEAFLGRVPDTLIARFVDKSVETVRSLRKGLNIKAYNIHKALQEAEAAAAAAS